MNICVPSNVADMQGIYNELSGKILAGSDGLFKICVNDVVQSVNRLKSGKSNERYSDHVINGPHQLFVLPKPIGITYLLIQCYVGAMLP